MLKLMKLSCLLIALLSFCSLNAQNIQYNLEIETTNTRSGLPEGWIRRQTNYTVQLDTTVIFQNQYSIRIASADSIIINPRPAGGAMYKVPAGKSGKVIELRAKVKGADIQYGVPQLVLSAAGQSGRTGYEYGFVREWPAEDWQDISVRLSNDKDADWIGLELLSTVEGVIWYTDIRLLIDGIDYADAPARETVPAELDKEFDEGSQIEELFVDQEAIDRLYRLGLVWGFLKYYHPAVASGKYNWDYELFRILPSYMAASKPKHAERIVSDLIERLGKYETERKYPPEKKVRNTPDLDWIGESGFGGKLHGQLQKIRSARRTGKNHYIDLTHKVPVFQNESTNGDTSPDLGYRILSLFRYWNAIHYYFPYKDLIDTDWTDILKEFIPRFIEASDEKEYKLTVLELIAGISDGHASPANEYLYDYIGGRYATSQIQFIEGQPIVCGFWGTENGLRIGDIIISVDGQPVDSIISRRERFISASNRIGKLHWIGTNLLTSDNDSIDVEYMRDSSRYRVFIDTYDPRELNFSLTENRPDTCYYDVADNIAYVHTGTMRREYINKLMPLLMDKQGIILDLRGYSSGMAEITNYFLPEPVGFARLTRVVPEEPGLFVYESPTIAGNRTNPNYYKGKLVILSDNSSRSATEFLIMALKTAPDVKIVGSSTAGVDGNTTDFLPLSGNLRTRFSGLGVYYPDGTNTQRIGIVPDIETNVTIRGIKNGEDEILEAAIRYIQMN